MCFFIPETGLVPWLKSLWQACQLVLQRCYPVLQQCFQSVSEVALDQLKDVNLSSLLADNQEKVRSLLKQYASVFSAHDGDLGCTNLIAHKIPLMDDVPVRQHFRRIPPSDYDVVKGHINQLLNTQVIRAHMHPK